MAHVEAGGGGAAEPAEVKNISPGLTTRATMRPAPMLVRNAFDNEDHNIFFGVHSGPPEYSCSKAPLWNYNYKLTGADGEYDPAAMHASFTATVPKNTIVVLITPTNLLAESVAGDEVRLRKTLCRPSSWMTYLGEAARAADEAGGDIQDPTKLIEYAKVYFPGDPFYNQSMAFDETKSMGYYDVYYVCEREKGSDIYKPTEVPLLSYQEAKKKGEKSTKAAGGGGGGGGASGGAEGKTLGSMVKQQSTVDPLQDYMKTIKKFRLGRRLH